jgi:heavy metal translocating P-type ATPase
MKQSTSQTAAEAQPPPTRSVLDAAIAAAAMLAIGLHLGLRFTGTTAAQANWPLIGLLAVAGSAQVGLLASRLVRAEFGSDLLAGISIVTSALLAEYLAGSIVVLMLAGGAVLEQYAVRRAAGVLRLLARRMPSVAHRHVGDAPEDVSLSDVAVGDLLSVFPHEICPVDGVVVKGHGAMDEAYLTGEPFKISKTPGSTVLSGAINGETMLVIRAERRAIDSRYAQIMQVMQQSQQHRPRLRRLGDRLGAAYTPLALAVALAAWMISGDPVRFLAVLVVATPCPLLIGIPVAIIGAISLSAKHGIIIKDPLLLEQIDQCRTAIFDKTGTLTYGEPALVEQDCAEGMSPHEVLRLAASLELYSRHPLAAPILKAASQAALNLYPAAEISEPPGQGLVGIVGGQNVEITGRKKLLAASPQLAASLAPATTGMECIVLVDGRYAARYRFRDVSRADSPPFIGHLGPNHRYARLLLVSGDQEAEVRHLAEEVGIDKVYAGQSPEDKLRIVRQETAKAKTLFVGDGINDAPALMAATVGVAFGKTNDITAEAAGAVVLDGSFKKLDELFHVGRRLRHVALQTAIGGMTASMLCMLLAACGGLTPVQGALGQEVIDVLAVLNALRAAHAPRSLSDFQS